MYDLNIQATRHQANRQNRSAILAYAFRPPTSCKSTTANQIIINGQSPRVIHPADRTFKLSALQPSMNDYNHHQQTEIITTTTPPKQPSTKPIARTPPFTFARIPIPNWPPVKYHRTNKPFFTTKQMSTKPTTNFQPKQQQLNQTTQPATPSHLTTQQPTTQNTHWQPSS